MAYNNKTTNIGFTSMTGRIRPFLNGDIGQEKP